VKGQGGNGASGARGGIMAPYANRPRVSGFRIQGSEFRVYDLGLRVMGLLWFRV
jgi:hypothetical protein